LAPPTLDSPSIRNNPYLYQERALAENSLGRYEQAKAGVEKAIRLSPRDPNIGFWRIDLGDAEINLGRFDAAIDEYRKALDMGLGAIFAHTNLAAAYAHAGKMDVPLRVHDQGHVPFGGKGIASWAPSRGTQNDPDLV
jgi:tetratricopeptide (TPR) repeat protein